jgi:putative addiction module component (TIGR02574 family)
MRDPWPDAGVARNRDEWENQTMLPADLVELLKLPADERAELAIALWESLSPEERAAEFELGPEECTELDRRWAEHLADPASAIPWEEVRRKLRDET